MPTAIHVIERRICDFIEVDLHVPPDEIETDANLGSFGLSSAAAVRLIGELEDAFDRRLSPTMVYDFPTIKSLAEAVAAIEPICRERLT